MSGSSWLNNLVDSIVHVVQHNIVHSWQHNSVHSFQSANIFFFSKNILNFENILACCLVVISVYRGQRRKVCAFTFVGGKRKVPCRIIQFTFAMFPFV